MHRWATVKYVSCVKQKCQCQICLFVCSLVSKFIVTINRYLKSRGSYHCSFLYKCCFPHYHSNWFFVKNFFSCLILDGVALNVPWYAVAQQKAVTSRGHCVCRTASSHRLSTAFWMTTTATATASLTIQSSCWHKDRCDLCARSS